MDEPTITDLSTREEAEEDIDFEKGEVGFQVQARKRRCITGLLVAFPRASQEEASYPYGPLLGNCHN